jgi:hypothetical protein
MRKSTRCWLGCDPPADRQRDAEDVEEIRGRAGPQRDPLDRTQ